MLMIGALCGANLAPAYGVALGGKWPSPNYSYFKNLNGYTGYDAPSTYAGNGWTSATKFSISLAPPTSALVAYVVDAYGTTDWFGIGYPGPDPFSGPYTYGYVHVNASWLNTRHFNCTVPGASACAYPADTAAQKQCVSSHEMGHVIRLAHTPSTSSDIMNIDHGARCHAKALTGPTGLDASAVLAIYP